MDNTSQAGKAQVRFECIEPILRVENMQASLEFYVDLLGFESASRGNHDFHSSVARRTRHLSQPR